MNPTIESLMSAGYELTQDRQRLTEKTLAPLYAQTYWAATRPETIVKKSLENSFIYGIFFKERPVAFLRLVTDYATFAYLCDVIVDEPHRGKGLSKWMLQEVLSHPEISMLRRICLMTKDAQGLYKQFGFESLEDPTRYMEILRG